MQIIYETTRTLTITSPRYDLGGGPIRSFVLKGRDSSLTLVSPPMCFHENEFKEIEKIGAIKALVASNKFHYLGITSWKKRFPEADIYTSDTALSRLKKKIHSEILSINELKSNPDIFFLPCPGTRNGEILVVCKEENGWVWYITDLFFNFMELPTKLFPRLMVKRVCGEGIVANPFCRFLFIKDRKQVKEWLIEKFEEFPPNTIIFSHGNPVYTPELVHAFKKRVHEY